MYGFGIYQIPLIETWNMFRVYLWLSNHLNTQINKRSLMISAWLKAKI